MTTLAHIPSHAEAPAAPSDSLSDSASAPTLRCLITAGLIARGFGGLFNEWGDCACRLGDLFPCGAPSEDCTAGYVHEAAAGWDGFEVKATRPPRCLDRRGEASRPGVHEEESE
jgi:hypothetical protein